MTALGKHSIAYLVVACFVLFPVKTLAYYEASGCGGCGAAYFHTCAQRFCDEVDSFPGWTQTFCDGCSDCSQDYYRSSASGGSENSYIDGTDIHFRNSHCTTAWDSFWGKTLSGIPCSDGVVTPGEVYDAWGDYDLEWIGSKCCSLLRDSSKGYWATAMDGLHLILGYKTSSYGATNFGRIWAQKMRQTEITILWWTFTIPSQTVTQAWFTATDLTQPSGTVARVIAETDNCYNDHLWGNGYTSPDPVDDSWYWWWDHSAGSPEYLAVNGLKTMYVYEVLPRNVSEQYARQLGSAFGMNTDLVGDLCDSLVMLDLEDPCSPRILQISKATGQYYYQDQGKLFVFNRDAKRYDPGRAGQRAQGFLTERKLFPSDVGDYAAEWDTIVEGGKLGDGEKDTIVQNTCAVYARHLEGARGEMVSVAGPGARLKVYIYGNGEIMGGLGNWRPVEQIGQIQVKTNEETWSMFEEYGNRVSVAPVQSTFDKVKTNMETATQVYYELPGGAFQKQLIPCWVFEAEYYDGQELVTTADTYIPAAPSYMAPVVNIIAPPDGAAYNYGKPITFDCRVESGLGTPPYTYRWESSVDGFLSNQRKFTTSSLSVNCSSARADCYCDCAPAPHRISVTAVDSKGLHSTDTIALMIKGPCRECPDCADINRDGVVNFKDVGRLGASWLDESAPQD